MTARLYDHVLVEAKKIPQREQLLLGGVHRRVFPLRRVGEFVRRTEYVTMRIHTPRRNPKLRLRRIWMKRDIGRIAALIHYSSLFGGLWRQHGPRRAQTHLCV